MHGGILWFRRHFATKPSRRAGTRDLGNRGEGGVSRLRPYKEDSR